MIILIVYGIVLHLCLLLLRCQSHNLDFGGWDTLGKLALYETKVTISLGCFHQRFLSCLCRNHLQILSLILGEFKQINELLFPLKSRFQGE